MVGDGIPDSMDMNLSELQELGKSESVVAQSCLTLCKPMDCSLPCSSVHGIQVGCQADPEHTAPICGVQLRFE